jgi:hypothetical protein
MVPPVRILVRTAAIVVIACLFPATLQAGDLQGVFVDANYAKPVRFNFGGSLFFSHEDVANSDGGSGIIVGGSVGRGGMAVWGGEALLGPGTFDVRAVVTRTWDNPRTASANSTYVGGEVSGGLLWRVSVGCAKRVSGPSTGDGHIITWGVGVEFPVWFDWFR